MKSSMRMMHDLWLAILEGIHVAMIASTSSDGEIEWVGSKEDFSFGFMHFGSI